MNSKIKKDTIIIGAGISGLAAAKTLLEKEKDFILLTDRLGGRLLHSVNPPMNLGATYINDDYKNVRKFVARGLKLKLRKVYSSNGEELVPFFHPSNIRYVFGMLKLLLMINRLRNEVVRFRKKAPFREQRELLNEFPLMRELSATSAESLMNKLGLDHLYSNYFKHVFYATCFASPEKSNALFFLGTLFPLLIDTYVADFTDTYKYLVDPIKDKITIERVTALQSLKNNNFCVSCGSGETYLAKNVVIAVPYHNARKFYEVPKSGHNAPGTVLYVRGERKGEYAGKQFMLFNPEIDPVCLIWEQETGADLIFALGPNPDLSKYYSDLEVLEEVNWKTAVVLSNENWVPQKLGGNLYLAGDYNLCGMEDSYISGVFAANEIIKNSA